MHSGDQSTYDVGVACGRVVHRSWFVIYCTGVIVVNITTMGLTEFPILPMFVGSGRTKYLLLAAACTAKTHGWLLWETMAVALTTTIAFIAIDKCALLLSRGIAAAWGLLADSHAELLDACKLVLYCNQAGSLALHGSLHGGIHCTKVCKQVTIQCNQGIVIHGGHTLFMLQGRDCSLVDECNCVGLIFLEGVKSLNDRWDHLLARDPIFVLLGIHPTALDDAQANVDDIAAIHWVACSTCVCVCFWPPVPDGVL